MLAPLLATLLISVIAAETLALSNASSATAVACLWVLLLSTLAPFLSLASFIFQRATASPSHTAKAEARTIELFTPAAFGNDLWLAYHEFNRSQKATRPRTKVIFIGDSLMMHWSTPRWRGERALVFSYIYVPQTLFFWVWLLSYPFLAQSARVRMLAQLVSLLDVPHPLLDAMDGINLGIGGDRTRHVLWRIQDGELDSAPPSLQIVWCLVGVNDMIFREAAPAEAAAGIVACAQELDMRLPKGVRVVIQALVPVKGGVETDPQLVDETNAIAQREVSHVCSGRVRFIDLGSAFRDERGEFNSELFSDESHPNEAGYAAWSEALMPHMRAMHRASGGGPNVPPRRPGKVVLSGPQGAAASALSSRRRWSAQLPGPASPVAAAVHSVLATTTTTTPERSWQRLPEEAGEEG